MDPHGKQHNAAACLCRRGYDLAAFVQHGTQEALGLELSPTAVRCSPSSLHLQCWLYPA